MKRHIQIMNDTLSAVVPNGGEGYYPADIRRLYHFPDNWKGAGQTVGILEFSSGYSLRDATEFWRMHGIPAPSVQFVSVDGTRNDGGQNAQDEEASLDVQWAGALASEAKFVVYEANGGQTYADFSAAIVRTLDYILHDANHHPSVLSISYGDAESSFTKQALEFIALRIQALDAKGVTVCIASGDQGAYGLHNLNGPHVRHADAPATSPYAVAVGGTHLNADGSEEAWTYHGPQNGGATGGGFSDVFVAPVWQVGLNSLTRGIPDIALNADPASGYQLVFQGRGAVVGGTSVACPIFAAIVALANEARASQGKSPISGLAEVLYRNQQTLGFRDVTKGNNTFNGVTGFLAQPGWDATTGFGSLDVAQFVTRLIAL